MFKSLYSGVSGLGANLTNLDVIGNNIANSNTVGFKSGRVTFNEMLTQTIKSASRPVSGGLGGTNPQQIGLGTMVGSIDTNFSQGNFQTTGRKTDLAIQGSGFFVLSDGNSLTYTRAGIFGLDSENVLVNPSTGLRVQGIMADADGVIGAGAMTDIFIDPGQVVPAEASTAVELMGNLDASSDAKGTIMESLTFLAAADGTDILSDMSGQEGMTLGLNAGDLIYINGREQGAAVPLTTQTYSVADGTSYADMVSSLNTIMAAEGHNITFAIASDGALEMTNNTGTVVEGFSLSVIGNTAFNSDLNYANAIAAGETVASSELRAFADETDCLADLYDSDGNALDIDLSAPPAILNLSGTVGGDVVEMRQMDVTAATTLADLMTELEYTLSLNSTPISINEFGQMVVEGEVGMDAAIGKIGISEDGAINTILEEAFSFNQTQQAADQQTFSMATTVYDSLGVEHTVNFTFEKVPGLNEWIWDATLEGNEVMISGDSGRVRFSDTGVITNFSFDDDSGSLTFQPQPDGAEGAANVDLEIDYGIIGGLTGLTQFEGTGSLQAIADGYGSGTLVDFNIDQSGVITGIFSNDTMQDIARIGIATFANPDGLMREANNTYRRSGNSGQAMETFAGIGNGISLVPGALETSNVDLAKEFTNLVVAQRSFQASSRVITTADQVMQELVNLIR